MSIFSGMSTNSGFLTGGIAAVGAVAIAATVVLTADVPDAPPVIGDAPTAVVTPNSEIVTASTQPSSSESGSAVASNGATLAPTESPAATEVVISTETPTSALGEATESGAPLTGDGTVALSTAPVVPGAGVQLGGGQDHDVSATVIGDTIVASSSSEQDLNLSTSSAGKPKVGGVAAGLGQAQPVRFDLVRVDKFGGVVVAGKALPGGAVDVYLDGDVIAEVIADTKGAFVALFDIPVSAEPQVMSLAVRDDAGDLRHSSDRVLVMGREVVKPSAEVDSDPISPSDAGVPQVIIATDSGVKVLQPAPIEKGAPEVQANVTLDLITYDTDGEVVLAGRGTVDTHVRIYVNDAPVKTEAVGKDGSWQLSLPEVNAGVFTLRVDEIDEQGQVTSRLETPFQKEQPEAVKRVASNGGLADGQGGAPLPGVQKITVQTGATLWALAEARYGQGDLYMQIFNANRDTIRDPDLIYPGQIFAIPE